MNMMIKTRAMFVVVKLNAEAEPTISSTSVLRRLIISADKFPLASTWTVSRRLPNK
jgi:hypothetical protein